MLQCVVFLYLSTSGSNISSSMSLVNRVYDLHVVDRTEKCILLNKMKKKFMLFVKNTYKYIKKKKNQLRVLVHQLYLAQDVPTKDCQINLYIRIRSECIVSIILNKYTEEKSLGR